MTSVTTLLKKKVNAELLFTDTDRLTYEITSEDVYEEFFKHKHLFHFLIQSFLIRPITYS